MAAIIAPTILCARRMRRWPLAARLVVVAPVSWPV